MIGLAAERNALDRMEGRLARQGYRLVRQPEGEEIPAFLKGYQPDAIALGKEPKLVIEFVSSPASSAKAKVSDLQKIVSEHPEWRLEVIYLPPDGIELQATSEVAIEDALIQAEALAGSEPRAALLLAWAALEALGRKLHPDLASRGVSSGSLIDLLVSQGDLEQRDQGELRELGRTRNRIAHGQLDLIPPPADVLRLVQIARSL